jgi:hypothetical protein
MNETDTTILAQLVRARHACLVRLHDLGARQLGFIEGGNMTALLDLLAAKQRPLLDLQRIERALAPYRDQDPESRVWSSPQGRAACAAEVEQCEQLLRVIVEQEKGSEAALVLRRDDISQQLQGVHAADTARGAYAMPGVGGPSQIDLSSES